MECFISRFDIVGNFGFLCNLLLLAQSGHCVLLFQILVPQVVSFPLPHSVLVTSPNIVSLALLLDEALLNQLVGQLLLPYLLPRSYLVLVHRTESKHLLVLFAQLLLIFQLLLVSILQGQQIPDCVVVFDSISLVSLLGSSLKVQSALKAFHALTKVVAQVPRRLFCGLTGVGYRQGRD